VREYVDPTRRPALARELDRLLPSLLDRIEACDRRATFFVLGEVATELPDLVREIAARGHEVAGHGYLHLRRGWLSADDQRSDAARCKDVLEDLIGAAVLGFRAPEWSLRRADHPALWTLAELGYLYDSSLSPAFGIGASTNPRRPVRLASGLLEIPPLAWGPFGRAPLAGWTLRTAPLGRAFRRLTAEAEAGGCPLVVIHPWEVVSRELPGDLTGMARYVHEAGRRRFAEETFDHLLRRFPWTSIRDAVPELAAAASVERVLPSRVP
jgi:peptidoglycan/xylan/chitin deacetylase (PgdA/CDA1 family)